MICKVCKRYFRPKADKKYLVTNAPVGLKILSEAPRTFEAFDCPRCGCQNIVNIREVGVVSHEQKRDDSLPE